MADIELRIAALYPEQLNIYADRGNIAVLERRCEWRSIGAAVTPIGIAEPIDPDQFDLIYLGGGQDDDQRRCAADLIETKREGLVAAAARGAVVLGICGGYQLLGHSYELDDDTIEGVGLLDVKTVRSDEPRLIGNLAIRPELPSAPPAAVLAGFENHGGRTQLGADAEPLGRVISGHGNDGTSGQEGCRSGTVIGTYLHGPLLPANSWFADWLISAALEGPTKLEALDDTLELAAHRSACRAAGFTDR
jgi:CobQ-like glutamine amidotransferase family enzyme